ncbi:alpha beta hydrolase fold family [Ophiostoma piceae UAMH 11346]|uniref:Alpha beta hydrolase fold family n=1 Tax=Ophiostoma piceae (strain UAMH 11346) TaxID=1262450 RepID=S3BYD0_OPHP1|nr:alpha beta hydrolase fold family [Ophiostoma piceae UAMH 11346]
MDSSTPVPSTPPIPPRHTYKQHQIQQARRKNAASSASSALASSVSRNLPSSHGPNVSPASPEVISNLITSLSVISKPASSHFDAPFGPPPSHISVSSPPLSPSGGSFGVDYGAYASSVVNDSPDDSTPLDELAAAPPVIRTAKPPSGYSALTAPKSPSRENISSGGLKSLLSGRSSSRPSSKGSQASRDADTQSIGNLSIERGAASPTPDLNRKSSLDSWGRKQARSQKGLMYMSSKERLREKEAEKRRASTGGSSDRMSIGSAIAPRADPFLAEMPISEESHTDMPKDTRSSFDNGAPSPRPIPTRESSLHKTGPNASKRSSRRSSKHKTDASNTNSNTIHELDEQHYNAFAESSAARAEASRKRTLELQQQQQQQQQQHFQDQFQYQYQHASRQDPVPSPKDEPTSRYGASDESKHTPVRPNRHSGSQRASESTRTPSMPDKASNNHSSSHNNKHALGIRAPTVDEDIEDGAPSPAVAQGRRRSGRNSTDPLDGMKRSGSKLKRLSDRRSPQPGDKPYHPANGIEPIRNGRISAEDTHVVYERPESADSVDDAVEAYLCSPRLSQKIRHPQTGRVISFSEVGDSEGSAVFCCVGMGLTRYIMAFYDELALTLKLRLITPDRPGVGDSESYSDGTATPLGWPDDVYAICQALKITKFSILAHSAGAIYALATALRMPQHIRGRIHLLAPWIPPSQMSVFGSSAQTPLPPTNAIPTSQRILRALPTPFLKAANSSFMSATSSSITSSLPKTPKRKRKSNASLAKEREKEALKNQTHPPLPSDNKENQLASKRSGNDPSGPSPPPKDFPNIEEMERLRLHGASPGPHNPSEPTHRKSASNTSGSGAMLSARDAREAAVLAAAADAIADRERQATYDLRLTHAIWELATTGANPAVDLLVCLERRHTIGFRYVDITRPVIIHHGSRDTRVPVENVRWLGKTMRRCEVRVLEGEGHGLMASAAVMGGVLMEIAKEWEDWGRLTGSTGSRTRDGMREERGRRNTIGMAR